MALRSSKRRKLTSRNSDDDSTKLQNAFFNNATNWRLEQEYEAKPRKGKRQQDSGRLPIKTTDGVLRDGYIGRDDDSISGGSDSVWPGDENDGESQLFRQRDMPEKPQVPEREQIRQAKEELAKIALKLNIDPEENSAAFKALSEIGRSRVPAIKKLCLLTQMAVYRDVIPGYRIRPLSEEPAGEQLSKDVRRIRSYEQALISGYQAYVKELSKLAKGDGAQPGPSKNGLDDVAITCACTLLTSVPHFNFRGEMLRILVGKLSKKTVDEAFIHSREALETLFRDDDEGRASMEAASLLAKMMRARDYWIDESVLNLFLHLRLLSEFSGKASQDQVDRPTSLSSKTKDRKKTWEVRTKRERKLTKEKRALDKDMAQADASVGHEEREQMQSETLKLVFATYFRILKQRQPHLMGAVLEGLAKYAHLINQNFFGDLLEALKDLIRHSDEDSEGNGEAFVEKVEEAGDDDDDDDDDLVRNPSREALLCTVTAFALLAGQDAHNARADLHLDLSFFTTHLFRGITPLCLNPDVELGAKSLHLPDPDSPQTTTSRNNKVNLQTTTVLLIRCLTAVLLPSYNIRSVPPLRLAAFAKQLMSGSLHLPEKSCQAVLALLSDVSHAHGKKISSLWNTEERKGDGTYNPLSETVEGSNPFTTTVWEGEILRKHFCPKVREGVKILQKSLPS